MAAGVSVVPAPVISALLEGWTKSGQRSVSDLTEEEIDLLRLVAAGLESLEIAERLHVSERTAKQRVAALLRRIERRQPGAGGRLGRALRPPPLVEKSKAPTGG